MIWEATSDQAPRQGRRAENRCWQAGSAVRPIPLPRAGRSGDVWRQYARGLAPGIAGDQPRSMTLPLAVKRYKWAIIERRLEPPRHFPGANSWPVSTLAGEIRLRVASRAIDRGAF